MITISYKEYSQRINPWVNPSACLAHYLPFRLPKFNSQLSNECFLFALSFGLLALVVLLAWLSITGVNISTSSSSANKLFDHNHAFTQISGWLIFGFFSIVVFRISSYLLSMLTNRYYIFAHSVVVVFVLVVASRLLILDESPSQFRHSITTGLDISVYAICAWIYARKNLQQMRAASELEKS